MNEVIKHKIKHNISRFVTSTKWVIFSIIVGIIVGICATAFFFGLSVVTDFRIKYPWLLFFLPSKLLPARSFLCKIVFKWG